MKDSTVVTSYPSHWHGCALSYYIRHISQQYQKVVMAWMCSFLKYIHPFMQFEWNVLLLWNSNSDIEFVWIQALPLSTTSMPCPSLTCTLASMSPPVPICPQISLLHLPGPLSLSYIRISFWHVSNQHNAPQCTTMRWALAGSLQYTFTTAINNDRTVS